MSKYKTYVVTVEMLRYDGKVDHTRQLRIKAKDKDEAEAIVHNHLVFSREPKFCVSEVKEVEPVLEGKGNNKG